MISDYTKYRIYETLPGLLIWAVLIGGFVFSFIKPLWVIYFIIIFDIFWVHRVVYFSVYLTTSIIKYKQAQKTNWHEKLKLEKPEWKEYLHCIFLPVYNEEEYVVRSSIEALLKETMPSEQMIVVLAGEERKKEHFETFCYKMQKEYGHKFKHFMVTIHPKDLPDEIPGKGSNTHFAAHLVQNYIDDLGIPYEKVIVSNFDIDTIAHPQYFSYLTYKYLSQPDPTRASYQPVPLYNNNMWESPSVLRVMAFGTTFWLLTELPRPDRMITFSSHSMSFKALVDVGFWEKRIVSEDSRIFWQCYLHYEGDYQTVPMYLPVSMDTVRDDNWWVSIKNLYKQQRRWAWGAEHIPFLLWHFPKKPKISLFWKFKYLFNMIEGKFSWSTAAVMILVFGRLPLWVAGDEVRQTVLFQNTPHILEWLMGIAMLGILVSMTYSLAMLPPRPNSARSKQMLIMVLQWVLLPISLLVVGAIPAIDSVTRLMFGKYLGFDVSKKQRKILGVHTDYVQQKQGQA